MGRQDDRGPRPVHLAQKIPHRTPELDIHPGRGLIEDQEPGLVGEGARDHEPAFEAAGERARAVMAALPQPEFFRYFSARSRASGRSIP